MKFITLLLKFFISLISLSQVGNAILNNDSFKNISKQFKPEFQQCSPTVGKAALERGLIYNLRFFGPITHGIDKSTGRRVYTSDIGQDSLMRLLILLFPSSAGELASSSEVSSNFGKYATSEMVAMLLNYAHACRKLYTHESDLDHETNVVNTKKAEEIRIIKGDKQFYTDENIRGIAAEAFAEKELLREKYGKKGFDTYRNKFKDCFDSALKKLNKSERFFLDKAIDDILLCVENSIKDEISNPSELYPVYKTEQVMLAFFCHKFNEKYDLWRLIFDLDEDLLNPTTDFGELSTWDDDSAGPALASHSGADLDLDFVFANNFLNIGAPIPYQADASPASNGNCPYFDRSQELDPATSGLDYNTFADCVDIMIRHFANIMLYNQSTKQFVLPQVSAEQSPYYFNNFATFYGAQTPTIANDGSQRIRGLWNRVVGDLNWNGTGRVQDDTSVRYNKMSKTDGQNEVDTGYINFIKIWQKILGSAWTVDHYDTAWTVEQKKDWLERSFKSLIRILNPTFRGVEITFSADFREDLVSSRSTDKDLFGRIIFKIKNMAGQQFQFDLNQSPDHGTLDSISYRKKVNTEMYVDSSLETLRLLDPRASRIPIYELLAAGELSNDGKKLIQLAKITDLSGALLSIIRNIISSINSDDIGTINYYIFICRHLFENTADIDAKTELVRGMKAVNADMLLFITDNDIPTPNLTHIHIDKKFDRGLMVPASVKFLRIGSPVRDIDLTQSTELEELYLGMHAQLISYKAPPSLKKLEISGKVGLLDLTHATQLEEFELDIGQITTLIAGPSLKKFTLYGKVNNLDLSRATQLEEFYLGMSNQLDSYVAPPSLKRLNIDGKVDNLDLSRATQLEEFELDKGQITTLIAGPSLKKLTLRGKVNNLDLSQALQLEEFYLGKSNQLDSYVAPPSLKKLTLRGKVDLLDLSQAIQLEEFYLGKSNKLTSYAASPSLKKLTLRGKVDLLDLRNATENIMVHADLEKISEIILKEDRPLNYIVQ